MEVKQKTDWWDIFQAPQNAIITFDSNYTSHSIDECTRNTSRTHTMCVYAWYINASCKKNTKRQMDARKPARSIWNHIVAVVFIWLDRNAN